MPLNDFFTYRIEDRSPGKLKAIVSISGQHPLYKGHFPGQPVTPGVVLVEIIRQVLSKTLYKNLMLTSAKEIKFMAAVIPTEISDIELNIDYKELSTGIEAKCIFSGNGKIFTKIQGDFSEK